MLILSFIVEYLLNKCLWPCLPKAIRSLSCLYSQCDVPLIVRQTMLATNIQRDKNEEFRERMQNCTRRANSLNIQKVCRMSGRLQYDEGNKTERIPEGFSDFSHFHLQLVVKPSVVPMKHVCVK